MAQNAHVASGPVQAGAKAAPKCRSCNQVCGMPDTYLPELERVPLAWGKKGINKDGYEVRMASTYTEVLRRIL